MIYRALCHGMTSSSAAHGSEDKLKLRVVIVLAQVTQLVLGRDKVTSRSALVYSLYSFYSAMLSHRSFQFLVAKSSSEHPAVTWKWRQRGLGKYAYLQPWPMTASIRGVAIHMTKLYKCS
ncbi:uncharacterized protein RBU33_004103 isoform 1-T1 [Hipposideros larvatus]